MGLGRGDLTGFACLTHVIEDRFGVTSGATYCKKIAAGNEREYQRPPTCLECLAGWLRDRRPP